MGPSLNLHILPSCMHTCTGAPLKVTLSLRSMPLQYLHLNTGKFKGAWRFCTFCLKLSRPMGTKSHTSKALPASIITKRIGLMVFHWATFRSGCVYLSFPGRFPHVSITHTQKNGAKVLLNPEWCRGDFLDSEAAAGVAPLSYSIWKVCKSGFHVSSAYKLLRLCSPSSVCVPLFHTFAVFSLHLRLSMFFHRPDKLWLIKMRAFAVTHSSVTNKRFSHSHSLLVISFLKPCGFFTGVK